MKRLLVCCFVFLTQIAWGNPRLLPLTYQVETEPGGHVELEQYLDWTPARMTGPDGKASWGSTVNLQTELEIGLGDRMDLGFYLVTSSFPDDDPQSRSLFFNGVKARTRIRLSDPTTWPIDVGVYFEVSALRSSDSASGTGEIELEGKVLLQKQLGSVRLMANLTAEHEFYFSGERAWVLNPSMGMTFELTPKAHLGLEYFMHAEFSDPSSDEFHVWPHHYLGPTLLVNFGPVWWTNGVYLRCDRLSRSDEIGDVYGKVWVRSVVGLNF